MKTKDQTRKVYVHMLNGTLCATERALCCLVENYQTSEVCPLLYDQRNRRLNVRSGPCHSRGPSPVYARSRFPPIRQRASKEPPEKTSVDVYFVLVEIVVVYLLTRFRRLLRRPKRVCTCWETITKYVQRNGIIGSRNFGTSNVGSIAFQNAKLEIFYESFLSALCTATTMKYFSTRGGDELLSFEEVNSFGIVLVLFFLITSPYNPEKLDSSDRPCTQRWPLHPRTHSSTSSRLAKQMEGSLFR